jgi:hypothetical protein
MLVINIDKQHKDSRRNCSLDNRNYTLTLCAPNELTGDHKTDLDAIKLHIELEEL